MQACRTCSTMGKVANTCCPNMDKERCIMSFYQLSLWSLNALVLEYMTDVNKNLNLEQMIGKQGQERWYNGLLGSCLLCR